MHEDDNLRLIAYRIWEEEGRPNGRDFDHWLKAKAIWDEHQEFSEHLASDVGECGGCAT